MFFVDQPRFLEIGAKYFYWRKPVFWASHMNNKIKMHSNIWVKRCL